MARETPRMPSRQYAWSSGLVVSLPTDQDIFSATLHSSTLDGSRSAFVGIPVISERRASKESLVPILLPSLVKNSTAVGASSSCSVQPLVGHLLRRSAEGSSTEPETSDK